MAKRTKRGSSHKPIGLTFKERGFAAQRMMAAAQTNHRASELCAEKSTSKTPSVYAILSPAVSFSLSLLSVEQSLKLLILIRCNNVLVRCNDVLIRNKNVMSNHDSYELYRTINEFGRCSEGLLYDLIYRMNVPGEANNIDSISKRELEKCLKCHNSSYTHLRYFGLQKNFKSNGNNWKISERDRHIIWCLAQA